MSIRRRTILALLCGAALSSCDEKFVADLSAEPEYRSMIGARYDVVSEVVAYGTALNLNRRRVDIISALFRGNEGEGKVLLNPHVYRRRP